MHLSKHVVWALVVAIIVVALDQWTKSLASELLAYNTPVEVLPVFNLTLHHNPGAAWSILADAGDWGRWLLTGLSTVVSIVLIVWLFRLKPSEKLLAVSLALIIGGAVGNLWDRALVGYVVDFISVHWNHSYFPTFNIADSAITIGAGLMILDMILNPEKSSEKSED